MSKVQKAFVSVESANDSSEDGIPLHKADDALLKKLGYKSEFKREFSMLETISFSLAILAVSCGITTGYGYPLLAGGHFAMIWGWTIPCLFVLCIAASMAELASAMPTSAGLYYFSAKMASEKHSALASWITGWSNITGQVTLVCSIDYTCAEFITTGIAMITDGEIVLGPGPTFGILLAIFLVQAVLCSAGTRVLARMTVVIMLIIMGTTIAAIVSLLVCSRGNGVTPKQAFTEFENHTGWSNDGWAFILAFTSPMWSLTGYDSAAHIAEETAGAARAAPIAIMVGVVGTEVLGLIYYIAASFATTSIPDIIDSKLALPMGQVYLNILGKKGTMALWWALGFLQASIYRFLMFGQNSGWIFLQFLCGSSQVVDASRVVFAFSRDNALPGSRWWKQVNRRTQTPVNAVWFVMFLSAICGLLSFSAAAFDSLASASVIGLYISYVYPTLMRITYGKDKFVPGPFNLGRWSRPCGAIAVAWTVFMVVMLLFPNTQTANAQTINYAFVIIIVVFLFASLSWIFSARHWFTGPVPNIDGPSRSDSASYEEKQNNMEQYSGE
ncbi:amino acid transporter [Hygrophoropsis aurantiaca]|uniref:Amino acid transporter n=1 Tax=Hygrophoropsis aurantiaca TaxID=72124 RepID=A0ACB8A7E9_9AGAM|nr:amino acid transporter [Hygrophoropsis aurantiaca]